MPVLSTSLPSTAHKFASVNSVHTKILSEVLAEYSILEPQSLEENIPSQDFQRVLLKVDLFLQGAEKDLANKLSLRIARRQL